MQIGRIITVIGPQFLVTLLLACGPNPAGPVSDAPGPTGATGSGSEPDLSQVVVSPSSVAIATGGDRQFSATGRMLDGQETPVEVTWSATGGQITSNGLFQAGNTAGQFHVIARHTGGFADTASVTVSGDGGQNSPPPPPPPPPGGVVPECDAPATEWIWCDDFDQDRTASYFEFNSASGGFDRAEGVGRDGSAGMRTIFQPGDTGVGWLHLAFGRTPQPYFRPVDVGTADYREIYWRVYVRNQSGWTGGGGHKLSRALSFVSDSTWQRSLAAHLWSGSNGAAANRLTIDPASGTDESGNLLDSGWRWLGQRAGDTPLFDAAHVGEWYCIEARLKLNDAGQSNGAFQFWIDGLLEASSTDLNWVGSFDAYGINAIYLENYWNDGAPATQERYMDNFVVSTAPIGCL